MTRATEAGHERAAGEWQIEWFALPNILVLSSSALLTTVELLTSLMVSAPTMTANLEADHGLLMAEASMIALAPRLGREVAHDVVYRAVREARAGRQTFEEALSREVAEYSVEEAVTTLAPSSYLGQALEVCDLAVADWRSR